MPRWRAQAVTSWWPIATSAGPRTWFTTKRGLEGRHLAAAAASDRPGASRSTARQQVERRADARTGSWGPARSPRSRARPRSSRGRAQPPVERALDEAVAVLDRRGLGHDHQQADVRDQEEVDDVVGRCPRPGRSARRPRRGRGSGSARAPSAGSLMLAAARKSDGAADQAQPGTARLHRDVLDALHPAADEVAQRSARAPARPRQVCRFAPAEVGVHQHHALAQARELPAQRRPSAATCRCRPCRRRSTRSARRGRSAADEGGAARAGSSEGHAAEDGVQQGARLRRLLPQRARARRSTTHSECPPPTTVRLRCRQSRWPWIGVVVLDDERGVERPRLPPIRRPRSRTRT